MAEDEARAERWRAIRAEWEAGKTVAELSRTHAVSQQMIRRVKATEKWARPETPQLVALEGGRPPESEAPPAPETPATATDDDVSEEDLARGLRKLAKKAQDDLEAGRIKAGPQQSEADIIVRVADVTVKAIDKSRDVAGKKSGQPSGDFEKKAGTRRFLIVTPADLAAEAG